MIPSRREFVGTALGASALAMMTGTLSSRLRAQTLPTDRPEIPPEFPSAKPYVAGAAERNSRT